MNEYSEPLSEREHEILRLVATGATNRQVAHRLSISTNTVKVHLRNIFAKLGAASRTEATMIAVRRGWVAVPEAQPAPPTEAVREPPLPWSLRIALVAAAVLTVGGAVLSWPRSIPASSAMSGILPAVEGGAQSLRVNAGQESHWTERAQMPTRRAWLGLTAWNRRLYAVGGQGPEGVTGAVEVYDPETDTWSRGAEKPTPTAYAAAALVGEHIVVPGGCAGDGAALSVVEVYDPAADAWETVASLPRAVCAYALAVYDEKLYLFGGTDGERYVATTYVYDRASDRWEERAPMPQARALAGAQTLEGRIYVVGGYRAGQELASCTVYDPTADGWADCRKLMMPRGGLGLVLLGGQLYAIGGGWEGYLGFNERYDPSGDRWTAVETPLTGGWQGAGVTVLDLTVYAVGGRSDDYLSLTLAFEPLPFRIFIPATEH